MADEQTFRELIRSVRAGNEKACAEFVSRYEPIIRVAVRTRLTEAGMRRLFDSMDISQSILGNFFTRAALGQFDLDVPGQLVKLLVTMSRNHLINRVAQQRTQRRDIRRNDAHDIAAVVDSTPSPSEVISNQEMLEAFRSRLSEQERRVADLRTQDKSWAEIAAEFGGSADAQRVMFRRALDRVAVELRLEELQ